MKFVRYNEWATGLLLEDDVPGLLDIFEAVNGSFDPGDALLAACLADGAASGWTQLIARWDEARPAAEALLARAQSGQTAKAVKPLASVQLQPPLVERHSRVFAIGGNFAQHVAASAGNSGGRAAPAADFAAEKAQGHPPWGFLVYPETIVGSGTEVRPPDGIAKFDYEGEVAIVLGRGGRDINHASLRVWGYTAWNDFSIRDPRLGIGPLMDRSFFTWGLEKNFDTGHACGPYLVVDQKVDINQIGCRTRVNGELRQDFSTSEMIWSFADTVDHISRYITLLPGDMIPSGTGAGTAIESGIDGNRWLKPGDQVEVEVDGAGVLKNAVGPWRQA